MTTGAKLCSYISHTSSSQYLQKRDGICQAVGAFNFGGRDVLVRGMMCPMTGILPRQNLAATYDGTGTSMQPRAQHF
jgi:hypothetical protein